MSEVLLLPGALERQAALHQQQHDQGDAHGNAQAIRQHYD